MTIQNAAAETLLQSKGIAPTAMRILTLEFLQAQPSAVSLSELEAQFHKADRVTLYRTLKTFEQKGLVHAIPEEGGTRYSLCGEVCTGADHRDQHLHFHCTGCGVTLCLDPVDASVISLPPGFRADRFRFSAQGLCASCASQTMQ
ncbi:MAG TPA: transcriptional repressor [Chitinophagaceae bacterium]|jgi:Fur family ferric uptake transcriptional regulator|nr:transcriptional repressor [Chitinophagaceae bacterium]